MYSCVGTKIDADEEKAFSIGIVLKLLAENIVV